MNFDPTAEYEHLSPDEAERVDAICDRFERAWKEASAPDSEATLPLLTDYAIQAPGGERAVLIRELEAIERAYRKRQGKAIAPRCGDEAGVLTGTPGVPAGSEGGASVQPEGWPILPGLALERVVGSGGMGVVFKARQAGLDRDVAVKLLRDAHLAGAGQRERFHLEAQAVARLHHPHLVQIYDFGEVPSLGGSSSQPYVVLEYVAGGNLADRLLASPLPARDAAWLVETLAGAIHYAHSQGIIHRDLKPANILLQKADAGNTLPGSGNLPDSASSTLETSTTDCCLLSTDYSPKITDFGLVKLQDGSDLTRTGDILGTPSYMAPEQTTGKPGSITSAVDVYGLGAILYEALAGRPPFKAETPALTVLQVQYEEPIAPRLLQPTVPGDLDTICLKCLRKEPEQRYASARELADDLQRFRVGEPILARPMGQWERALRWCRRKPLVAGLAAALVFVVLGGLATALWQWRQTVAALNQSEQAHNETKAHLYLNEISRARHELLANRASRAERILDETPILSRGWEWDYLKRQCQTSLFTLRGNGSMVHAVSYSPNGKLLASGSGDWYSGEGGELVLWDARTGKMQRVVAKDLGTVYGVAFDPKSKLLASASFDRMVRLWDVETGALVRKFTGHRAPVTALAFSPDGKHLASCSQDTTVILWSLEPGKLHRRLTNHRAPVWGLAFTPDGREFASCDRNGIAHLWELASGRVVRSFYGSEYRDYRTVTISPDGTRLALGCYSGPILVYDLTKKNERPLTHFPNAGPILSLVFTPNGSLAWCSRDGHVRIQDARTGKDRYVLRGHEGWGNCVAMSPDGRRLASGGSDGAVRISDARADDDSPYILDDGAELPELIYDREGRLLAMGSVVRTTTAKVWRVAPKEVMDSFAAPSTLAQ